MKPISLALNHLYRTACGSDYRPGGALMFTTPAITAISIAIFAALSFGGGFVVSGWRTGAQMQRLSSQNAVLLAANEKCANDIQSARAGVKQVTDALDAKEIEAKAAMKSADAVAKKHLDLAAEIRNGLPMCEGETQCQAVEREQREYVQARARS